MASIHITRVAEISRRATWIFREERPAIKVPEITREWRCTDPVRRGGDRVPLPSALAQASVGRVARYSATFKWKNQVPTVVLGSPAYISWPDPGTNTSSPCQKSWMLQQNSLTGMAVPASRSISGDPSSQNWTGSRCGDPSLIFGVPLPSSSHVTTKGFEPDHGKSPASLVLLAQGSLLSLLHHPPPSLALGDFTPTLFSRHPAMR